MEEKLHQKLESARQIGDPLADQAIEELLAHPERNEIRSSFKQLVRNSDSVPDFYPAKLLRFFEETSALPHWADHRKMKQAASFFREHENDIMTLLGSLSLPYCYAAADGVKVLFLAERMKSNAYQRLQETARFVFDVMDSGAFKENGKGFRSIQKVRLMHAFVRRGVAQSGAYDVGRSGIPINQEDMAGTNLAFSFIVLRGLRKLGKNTLPVQKEAFLHYWKVIGHLMGVDIALLPVSLKDAFLLDKAIYSRNFRYSKEAEVLTFQLLESFGQLPESLPKEQISSYMRFLLGEEVAGFIGLPDVKVFPQWKLARFVQDLGAGLKLLSGDDSYSRSLSRNRTPTDVSFELPN